jgi:hypothetical protein
LEVVHERKRDGIMKRAIIAGAFAICAFLAFQNPAAAAAGPTRPTVSDIGTQPKTFLFVGNSFMYYNNSMHEYVLEMARAADNYAPGYRGTSITISGSGMSWHDMESYFKPGAVASYSFTRENKVVFNKFDKPFDVTIFQDCSQCPIHTQLKPVFHESVKTQGEIIRKHGAVPILLMTWAYEDAPSMTDALAQEYTTAGNANGMLVIPAGLAFANARAKQPTLKLYQKDKRHPTLAGTYLAAATIYSAIYKKPAGGLVPEDLSDDTARLLRSVAWETVQEYYGKSSISVSGIHGY